LSESPIPRFISLLACPDCGGDLQAGTAQLRCGGCHKQYVVRDGIPCLYPASVDEAHLHEEQFMADLMMVPPRTSKEKFIQDQWDGSKTEFWRMVKDNVDGDNKTFVNLGCGYDTRFLDLQKGGNTFVNFDLVFDLLDILRSRHGAESCVAGDINRLPFRKASFDYAISIDVIHHESDNLEALIGSFADLLKPGGTLFLEDPNAWGMFQIPKSVLLPRPVYRLARRTYHQIKRTAHRPADYEFPTSVWKIKKILKKAGFSNIVVHPNNFYPSIGPAPYGFYNLFSGMERVRRYHSYHYMISARKA
jgi:SAM-dependent methyltransferase